MTSSTQRPVAATFDIGRHSATTEISVELTAVNEATVTLGTLRRTSRDGQTVTASRDIFRGGIGNQMIEVSSEGGGFELAIDAGTDRIAHFTTQDTEPALYRWHFVADAVWSGGSVNDEASEIARAELAGEELPSHPVGGELPATGVPAMPSTITRPWAPDRDRGGPGVAPPTRGRRPVDG